MASTEFDTLAAAGDLQAAGVQAAHAEAIVSAVSKATGRLVSENRFETAITELRHDMDAGLARQAAALEAGLARQAAALAELRRDMEVGFAGQATALAELRLEMKAGLAEQAAAFAQANADIYRYLWVLGGSLVAVLSSLYMLAETRLLE